MLNDFLTCLVQKTAELKETGLYKQERTIYSAQDAIINMANNRAVINLCANNYLGLANHPQIIAAAHDALNHYGFGMASVRFICGTQKIHQELEKRISNFLGTEDTILYSSCFDANGGLFETLFDEQDTIISDALNHASIIDGIRLSKAKRLRYANNDMIDLEKQLQASVSSRYRLIATDGIFSMDGSMANLKEICALAKQYNSLVMVDDSHAVGFIGAKGRGTPEYCAVLNEIDIITGTLGKALGGASGGYTSGRKEIIAWLRQRSRPYLFSNTLAPVIAAASLQAISLIEKGDELRQRLLANSHYFRLGLTQLGYSLIPGQHPIIPIMLGDASLAVALAERLLIEGVYVIGFSYPVVPKGKARIRTQVSAAHTQADLDQALTAFAKAGAALGIIKENYASIK